jgi:hypothetical protein
MVDEAAFLASALRNTSLNEDTEDTLNKFIESCDSVQEQKRLKVNIITTYTYINANVSGRISEPFS